MHVVPSTFEYHIAVILLARGEVCLHHIKQLSCLCILSLKIQMRCEISGVGGVQMCDVIENIVMSEEIAKLFVDHQEEREHFESRSSDFSVALSGQSSTMPSGISTS